MNSGAKMRAAKLRRKIPTFVGIFATKKILVARNGWPMGL
jgi:hypothetical protein